MYLLPEKLNRSMNNEQRTMNREKIIDSQIASDAHCSMIDEFGFTLIEALVALVILTVSLGPALVLSSNISSTSSVIQNNLIAANLSQEGVEVIRALRDSNWHNGLLFDNGLTDGVYRIEWNSNSLIALGSNPPLKISTGLYNYSSGTDTKFKRTVTINKINSEELKITSEVTWTERGNRIRNVKAESHLFNWK